MNNKIIIGVDLGGTKIMTGAITQNGVIIGNPIKIWTGGNDPKDVVLNRIVSSIQQTIEQNNLSKQDILGIGLGSTGPLDSKNGIILDCPQLPTLNYFNIKIYLEDIFNIPIEMDNDANALIYGEYVFGAAKNVNNLVGFTLGTGIGAAIIINGKIWNGATGTAAEIWTSPYKDGIIEDYISGEGLKNMYHQISGKTATGKEIHLLADKGDKDALKTWKVFGKHLAYALAWTINLIDPEMIVLGGSISQAHQYFMPALIKHLQKQVCSMPAENIKIEMAKLGNNAGFIGAACLVLEKKRTVKGIY